MTDKVAGVVANLRPDGKVNVLMLGGIVLGLGVPDWYQPVIGDNVIIDYVGTQAYVDTCLTAGRRKLQTIPAIPTITVQNAAPGAGYQAIGSNVYVATNVSPALDIVFVRSSAGTTIPPATVTQTITPNASGTYDPTNGWRIDDAKPRQGDWAGDGSGASYGLWFYPTITAPAGRTLTSAQMTVVRDTGNGRSYGPMQLHLYLHNYTTRPGGVPTLDYGPFDQAGATPSSGAVATFDLPLGLAQLLLSTGTRKGLAIYSPAYSEYLVLVAPGTNPLSGQLTLTYT